MPIAVEHVAGNEVVVYTTGRTDAPSARMTPLFPMTCREQSGFQAHCHWRCCLRRRCREFRPRVGQVDAASSRVVNCDIVGDQVVGGEHTQVVGDIDSTAASGVPACGGRVKASNRCRCRRPCLGHVQ